MVALAKKAAPRHTGIEHRRIFATKIQNGASRRTVAIRAPHRDRPTQVVGSEAKRIERLSGRGGVRKAILLIGEAKPEGGLPVIRDLRSSNNRCVGCIPGLPRVVGHAEIVEGVGITQLRRDSTEDRKSTRLNSSHLGISY